MQLFDTNILVTSKIVQNTVYGVLNVISNGYESMLILGVNHKWPLINWLLQRQLSHLWHVPEAAKIRVAQMITDDHLFCFHIHGIQLKRIPTDELVGLKQEICSIVLANHVNTKAAAKALKPKYLQSTMIPATLMYVLIHVFYVVFVSFRFAFDNNDQQNALLLFYSMYLYASSYGHIRTSKSKINEFCL